MLRIVPWGFISIHAPARGATVLCNYFIGYGAHISIHAPARGATISGGNCTLALSYFNPRARAGRDRAVGL